MQFIETVVSEMGKGNFSFFILVVGIVQVIIMIENLKQTKKNNTLQEKPES